jgi:hypothetical protein
MGVYRIKWWFEDYWRYLVTAVAGLAVGAAAAVGVATEVPGLQSTESSTVLRIRTETATGTPTDAQTSTQTATAQGGAIATVPASGSVSYSGNGGKNLGTITVSSSSRLHWTNDGALIQINDDGHGIAVDSEAHSGTTAVEPETYKNVNVNASGDWTITIEPR